MQDASNANNTQNMFSSCTSLKRIPKLIVGANTGFANTFNGCEALEELYIEGTIAKNGLNLQYSQNLNTKSIVSIVEALSTTTEGLTITLSETAVNNMIFPFASDSSGVTYNSWSELESTKEKWTIVLKDV